ncbi:hypothetical protein EVAR_13505_1 [Eumeta japonica]|uniref:Uncharacterized protein n=1 Tax=Eumeta variegata TaxID=151549 RepID=A0A4C1UY38_EUMVA|nr:hypothetical protein EVAR_13505_1 [Eumeta japonica]
MKDIRADGSGEVNGSPEFSLTGRNANQKLLLERHFYFRTTPIAKRQTSNSDTCALAKPQNRPFSSFGGGEGGKKPPQSYWRRLVIRTTSERLSASRRADIAHRAEIAENKLANARKVAGFVTRMALNPDERAFCWISFFV